MIKAVKDVLLLVIPTCCARVLYREKIRSACWEQTTDRKNQRYTAAANFKWDILRNPVFVFE